MACLHSRIAAEAAFAVAVKNSAVIAVQVIWNLAVFALMAIYSLSFGLHWKNAEMFNAKAQRNLNVWSLVVASVDKLAKG